MSGDVRNRPVKAAEAEARLIYEPVGFGLLRTPLLPLDTYLSVLATAKDGIDTFRASLREIARAEPLRTALRIASPSLVEALEKGSERAVPGSVLTREERALMRFLARSSARATPYGAFSGVAHVELGASTTATRKGGGELELAVRPDMGWLLGMLSRQLDDPDSAAVMPLRRNSLLVRAGERLLLPYADVHGVGDARQIDVRLTAAVDAVLEAADGTRAAQELADEVVRRNPSFPQERVEALVQTLRELNVLTVAWGPRLSDADVVSALAEAPAEAPAIKAVVAEVLDLVDLLDDVVSPTAASIDTLTEVERRQVALHPERGGPYLQVDARAPLTGDLLSREVAREVAEALSIVGALTRSPTDSALEEYHNRCTEAYGVGAEIPLLDLLSEAAVP